MFAPFLTSLLGDLCDAFDEFLFYLSLIIIGYYLVTFIVDLLGEDKCDDVAELQLHSNGVEELQWHSNGMAGLVSCEYSPFANYTHDAMQALDLDEGLTPLEKDLALLEKELALVDKEDKELAMLCDAFARFESNNSYSGVVYAEDGLSVPLQKDELDNVVEDDFVRQEHHESYMGVPHSQDALQASQGVDFAQQEDDESFEVVDYA